MFTSRKKKNQMHKGIFCIKTFPVSRKNCVWFDLVQKKLSGNLIPKVYFLDPDVITKIGIGHAIIAGTKEVIISLWKHYKMCNPREQGESPPSLISPIYRWKNVTVTLLLLEQCLQLFSPDILLFHPVKCSQENQQFCQIKTTFQAVLFSLHTLSAATLTAHGGGGAPSQLAPP